MFNSERQIFKMKWGISMKYAFLNANLLDGNLDQKGNMPLKENAAVFVEDEVIIGVYAGEHPSTEGFQVVNLQGKYLMPGLINLHAHFVPAMPVKKPKPGKEAKQTDMKALKEKLTGSKFADFIVDYLLKGVARDTVCSGVTTVRTVGGVNDADAKMRDKIISGKVIGPRMLVANTAVSVPGGHMAGLLAEEATCPEDAVCYVREIAKTKPDLIKLMVTGGVLDASETGEPGVLKMPPQIVKAACDEAHALGYQVAAHTESTEGVRVALQNGVDTIEHGAKPDDEILRLFKERGAADVCTLSPALPYVFMRPSETGLGELGQKNGTLVFNGIVDCAKECVANGIPVGLGTDTGCPFITPYDMWRELGYFVKFCGVTPAFALHTATKVNAEILGIADMTGTIEKGKCADFIVAEKNPLDNFAALRNLSMVCAKGRLIQKLKIKRIKSIDETLDKINH